MPTTHEERRVITFYAFKGGVGRTMALANVAYRLAERHGLDVVAVDWDLEAPGLHTFFELPQAKLEQAKGLLDYCEDWEEAYRRNASEPPRPLSYLIPIEEGPGKPNHGSLRLLIAGKQDRQYDARLGRFDWKRFYAESAGAGAVEHLRSELVANADVILVDSRTGLTDPGGICTIQIPDGVVLMTAPNKQSIEGIERVARSIATAEPAQRAGRKKALTFLCMSRVPFVEETERTRRWFKEHEGWFDAGVAEGLWSTEEHRRKLETHVIPQRAYYGFDESLVGPAKGELAREPLAQAYDALTATLRLWTLQPMLGIAHPTPVYGEAEEGRAQTRVSTLLSVGSQLVAEGRYPEAKRVLEATMSEAYASRDDAAAMRALALLGLSQIYTGNDEEGKHKVLAAVDAMRTLGLISDAKTFMMALSMALIADTHFNQASIGLRAIIDRTTQLEDSDGRVMAAEILREALALAQRFNRPLPDEPALRQRLAELEATPPTHPSPPPAPRRARRKKA